MENGKALALIKSYSGKALVYARKEEIEAVGEQYESIVTVLDFTPDDFTNVGGGNFYPGKSATNRVSDAAGVSFTENCGTREEGDFGKVEIKQLDGVFQAVGNYAVIGWAQGFRLKPDGSRRTSSVCEYIFSIVDRCNMDVLNDQKSRYKSSVAVRKHLLELKKFSTQRASTGAELRVIRELVGMPTAIKGNQINQPMIFSQTVESTKFKVGIAREIMQTPDGRQAVVNALFNQSAALYGPPSGGQITAPVNVTPEPATPPESETEPAETEEPEDDIDFQAEGESETTPVEEAKITLNEYLLDASLNLTAKTEAHINSVLDDESATLEQVNSTIERIKAYLGKKQATS